MEKSKQDLRVVKTKRAIKEAFLSLITEKPVQKITVTELSSKAEISKGTFYLHYVDIFNLYNELVDETVAKIAGSFDPYPELFSNPEAFVRTFMFAQVQPMKATISAAEACLLLERNIQHTSHYPQCFIEAFMAKIYEVGKLTPCKENDLKLEFLLTGMLSLIITYPSLINDNPEMKEYVIEFVAKQVREAFPEFFGVN